MSSSINRIGVLTGGGDAPGLNAVIRAVVKTAVNIYGWSVVGIEDGFEGLLGATTTRRLDVDDVRGLLPRGGTVLGTSNRGHFDQRASDGGVVKNESAYAEAVVNFKRLGLDALIVIGGDGSQRIAHQFAQLGIPIVGVPKTIDNDLVGTDLTFGFDTALDIATEAIDRLHTTAESHDRVLLVEVMGRHVGWIALESGIAGGADVILIPEIPFSVEKVAAKVRERDAQGRRFSIVVVAEGAAPEGGSPVYQESATPGGARRLGGIAERVGREVSELTGKESRTVVLGHLQRGGTPTAFDRVLASCYGSAAVRAISRGEFGRMVAWRDSEIITVPLEVCVSGIRSVPADHHLIGVARDLSISFAGEGDWSGGHLKPS
ncbi:MAG TPA: ATP-dependent 6-phosphofructokinase [Blastocatellia bacterium]|nr:ATP-dependent 6-phosphofructokinase [Blastocatellia bacterium]